MAELVVKGQAEVIGALDEFERSADDLTDTHGRVVARLLPDVRAGTPKRTGALAVSWQTSATKDAGSIGSPLTYAGPIEFGTSRFDGFAMVRDAINRNQGDIVKGYEAALGDAGKRAGFRVTT